MESCLSCKKELVRRPTESVANYRTRRYCNMDCYYNRNTYQKKDCEGCTNTIVGKRRQGIVRFSKQRFCSLPCMIRWRERQYRAGNLQRPVSPHKFGSREQNPNWKGGTTSIAEKLRKGAKYRSWRKAVFERDNYTCQDCGKRGGDIEADHIKQFAYHVDLRFDISNGRTLCKACHRNTETYGNSKKVQYV